MVGLRTWLGAGLVALVLAGAAPPAAAQTREDTAAVLLEAARQLRGEGNGAAADAVLQLLRRRYAGTTAARDAQALVAQLRSEPEPTRSGRVELMVFGTTYGLWTGLAVPLLLDEDSPELIGAGLLLGGPLGFLATRAYLKDRPVSEGQARAISFGGTWGSWQGFGWTQLLGGSEVCTTEPESYCWDDDPSGATLVGGTLAGGLAGIVTGAVLARKPISSGVATTVSFGALWGTGYGGGLGALADLEGDDLLAATLVGGDVGILAMAVFAPRWNPSRSRARLVSLGGVVGLLGGLGADLILVRDNEDAAILIPMATSALGMVLAARATRHFDRPAPEGGPGGGSAPSPFGGALLRYEDGRLDMDVPSVRLGVERERGRRPGTSLHLPVLQARF